MAPFRSPQNESKGFGVLSNLWLQNKELKMKKTLLATVTISVTAFAYASTSSDSSALVSQQCKLSAEAASSLKSLQYGNTSIRKDVSSLIDRHLKTQENRDINGQKPSKSKAIETEERKQRD